jgi:archaeal flagellar protein FlaI
MGLKDKAESYRTAGDAKRKLAEAVEKAGQLDYYLAEQVTGEGRKNILKAAKELEVEGILRVNKRFLGPMQFVAVNKHKQTVTADKLLEMIEKRGRLSLKKAASLLGMSLEDAHGLACELEVLNLVRFRKGLLGGGVIVGDKYRIIKYRIDADLKKRRASARLIYTASDYLLDLARRSGTLTVADAARVLEESEAEIESKVKKMGDALAIEFPANPSVSPSIVLRGKVADDNIKPVEGALVETYNLMADGVPAKVSIISRDDEPMSIYSVETPQIGDGTMVTLRSFAQNLSTLVKITPEDITDQKKMLEIGEKFYYAARNLVKENFNLPQEDVNVLAGMMLHRMFGLGGIEILMHDDWLEEVCVNTSHIPVTAYHKRFGWVKTNIALGDERMVYNYAAQIGRKVEKDITSLEPIMDAHLLGGDRVNATLFPISNFGNTITIRKFARQPWTLIHYISPQVATLSAEMAAFLWMCFQYELNVIIGGGTASGKTSMLNCLCALIQPTQRVITIEDTRELNLPSYLRWNWVPLTTRTPNPEGKGEISMLDLIVTSLRMRPDRVVFGEIRRRREAEVLFEAMHTGHSVYSTIHADTAENLKRRLIEPPIEVPASEIEALHLMVVVYRDRKRGERKVFEIAEIIPGESGKEFELNYLYRWNTRTRQFVKVNDSKRIMDDLSMHTGMSRDDINRDLKEKGEILEWMQRTSIKDLEAVGAIMEDYYRNPQKLLERVRAK